MSRQENMGKCLNAIMDLKGVDELKSTVKQLHIFLKNIKMFSVTNVVPPNYLWIAKRGGGITTSVKTFTEYLYAARAIEFCGKVKSFEFKLGYIAPELFFSELTRFDNLLSALAGHHHRYKGVVCINIDEWLEHTGEVHFAHFLDYMASNSDRLLAIFCTYTDNKNNIEAVETALAAHVRFETLSLRFPDVPELVEFVESRFREGGGFTLTENAKVLLSETIGEISVGKNFKGFKSVEQLANDILYNILTTDLNDSKQISAEMIARYDKNSPYVKLAKSQIKKKTIGFTERSM